MMGKFASAVFAVAFVAGCTQVDDTQTTDTQTDGFTLIQHDDRTLEARVIEGDAQLHVLITETDMNVVDVTFDFGDPVIAFALDYNQGVGEFMPAGALDASDARLVNTWMDGIQEVIEMDSERQTKVEFAAVRQGSFMQIVPAGELLVSGLIVSERGWTHISPNCKYQNIGSGYTRKCGKGCGCKTSGKGCKGRCGQGCGGTSTPKCVGSTVYTRHCAKHDYGLGSWWAASDDFSFASNNASCGGNCY